MTTKMSCEIDYAHLNKYDPQYMYAAAHIAICCAVVKYK